MSHLPLQIVEQARIVTANGSEELLSLLCRACLNPGERMVTVHPSFPLHEINPLEHGALVTAVAMTENLQFDTNKLAEEVGKGCKILIFSNPSNPTGSILDGNQLSTICAAAQPDTLVIVDETYFEYAKGSPGYPDSLAVLSQSGLSAMWCCEHSPRHMGWPEEESDTGFYPTHGLPKK